MAPADRPYQLVARSLMRRRLKRISPLTVKPLSRSCRSQKGV